MANAPQRRLEADKRSKRADKKYSDQISDAAKTQLYAYNLARQNPTPENEEFAIEASKEADFLEDQRAREGGYDSTLNPRKKGAGYFKKGGTVSSASKRADGCASRGKTRGRMV